jgi:hypothetical protein
MGRQMDSQTESQTDGQMDKEMDRQINRNIEGESKKGQTNGCMYRRANGWADKG